MNDPLARLKIELAKDKSASECIVDRPTLAQVVKEVERLRAAVETMAEALRYYEDPLDYIHSHKLSNEESPPDFYEEVDAGRRAREALKLLKNRGPVESSETSASPRS